MFKLTGAKLRLDAQASLYHAACTQYNDIIQLFFFFSFFFPHASNLAEIHCAEILKGFRKYSNASIKKADTYLQNLVLGQYSTMHNISRSTLNPVLNQDIYIVDNTIQI